MVRNFVLGNLQCSEKKKKNVDSAWIKAYSADLLGYYAESSANLVPTFRDKLSDTSSLT